MREAGNGNATRASKPNPRQPLFLLISLDSDGLILTVDVFFGSLKKTTNYSVQ